LRLDLAAFAGAAAVGLGVASRKRGSVRELRSEANVCRRGLQTGIVGLPNVGKSTLFNALCDQGTAEAGNFPFCTIDPNHGKAKVPDKRLMDLSELCSSEKVTHEFIEYVDIAGLVKGASKGEGLGNKFLGNIRNCDAIVHVVRCFESEDITHVEGTVDPVRDMETINAELLLSDLDQCEKKVTKLQRDIVGKVENAKEFKEILDRIIEALEGGRPARSVKLTEQEEKLVHTLGLLTKKPVLYAANVDEEDLAEGNAFVDAAKVAAEEAGDQLVVVSAQVESELKSLNETDRLDFLEALGVEESGCESLVQGTYRLLGLRTYFTAGEAEARAWTIREGWKAPKAAGVIHTDFEKGFIKAETIDWKDLLECGSEKKAKEAGKMRIEGKEYVVQEGDVMHFLFQKR